MNITVKANNKVNLIKKIKLVVLDIKEKNLDYQKNGVVLELAQSIREMIDNIYKTADDEYIANILFYSKPLFYNYHGITLEEEERKIS